MRCVVYAVLVQRIGFRRLVAALSSVWMIEQQNKFDQNIKSNHDCLYIIKIGIIVFSKHSFFRIFNEFDFCFHRMYR